MGTAAGIDRSGATPAYFTAERSAEYVKKIRRWLESKHQHCDHQNTEPHNSYAERISFGHPKHRELHRVHQLVPDS
jgi:hypothetical protein